VIKLIFLQYKHLANIKVKITDTNVFYHAIRFNIEHIQQRNARSYVLSSTREKPESGPCLFHVTIDEILLKTDILTEIRVLMNIED